MKKFNIFIIFILSSFFKFSFVFSHDTFFCQFEDICELNNVYSKKFCQCVPQEVMKYEKYIIDADKKNNNTDGDIYKKYEKYIIRDDDKNKNTEIDWSKLEGVTSAKKSSSKPKFKDSKPFTKERAKEWAEEYKNLNGKKLYCKYTEYDPGTAFEFNRLNRVKISAINLADEKITVTYGKYKSLSNEIVINFENKDYEDEIKINRKNMTMNYALGSSCEILNEDENVDDKLELILSNLIIDKASGNKF